MNVAVNTNTEGFLFSRLPQVHEPLRRRDTVISREKMRVHRRTDPTGFGDHEIVDFERTVVFVRRAVAVAVIRLTRGAATCEIDREFEFADENGFLSCLGHMRESCANLLYGFEPYWPSTEYHIDVDLRVDDIPFDLKTCPDTREPVVHDIPADWRIMGDEGHLHPILRRRVFRGTVWSSLDRFGHDLGSRETDLLLSGLDEIRTLDAGRRLSEFRMSISRVGARITAI
jgi:hypothetical protein